MCYLHCWLKRRYNHGLPIKYSIVFLLIAGPRKTKYILILIISRHKYVHATCCKRLEMALHKRILVRVLYLFLWSDPFQSVETSVVTLSRSWLLSHIRDTPQPWQKSTGVAFVSLAEHLQPFAASRRCSGRLHPAKYWYSDSYVISLSI